MRVQLAQLFLFNYCHFVLTIARHMFQVTGHSSKNSAVTNLMVLLKQLPWLSRRLLTSGPWLNFRIQWKDSRLRDLLATCKDSLKRAASTAGLRSKV